MKKFIPLACTVLLLFSGPGTSAQYVWRHRACSPIPPGTNSTSFVINNKAYILGYHAYPYLYEYDPSTDMWMQKNNFPGPGAGVCSFVINDTAYAGLGLDTLNNYYTAFWKYNPATDQWTSIASFPGTARYTAMDFVINNKGYVGCGKGGGEYNDFYEYNPATNQWNQLANFPGVGRQDGFGIAVNDTGYMGMGFTNGSALSDIYKYNPVSNVWTPISTYDNSGRYAMGCFAINDTFYVTSGYNLINYFDDCWRYDVPSNRWIQEQNYGCIAPGRTIFGAFTLNGHGYIHDGNYASGGLHDLLEFGPPDTAFAAPVHVLGNDTGYASSFSRILSTGDSCTVWSTGAIGSQITVTTTGTYWCYYDNGCGINIDSINISQISLGLGDSITDAVCGASNGSAGIFVTSGQAPYRFIWNTGDTTPIISNVAAGIYSVTVTDSDNCSSGISVYINNTDAVPVVISADATSFCPGGETLICASGGYVSYEWNNGQSGNCITAHSTGYYYVNASDSGGCSAVSDSIGITVLQLPNDTITTTTSAICPGDSAQICAPQGFSAYTWNSAAGGGTGACIQAKQAGDYYVTVTDNSGCTAESNHVSITALQAPSVSISQRGDTLSVYYSNNVQWYLNNNSISGATQNTYIAQTHGSYTVSVTDTDGCTSYSLPIIYTGVDNIYEDENVLIYPNPLQVGSWKLEVGSNFIGAQIEISDDNGRLVYQSQIRNLHSEIDGSFAGGVYLLRITTGAGVVVRKLVKL